MNAPFYLNGAFGYPTAMALATLLGIGFGFTLERAGFGRSVNLAAQFYLTDMRVFKVMFSAIVTATVGLGLLGGVGVVDLAAIQIPETFLWPQIVGGVLLGVGFIVSGYCPGTAVVAAGSGNIDGLFSILGTMVGSLAFGFAYPLVEDFYMTGAMGRLTLPDVLGLPWPVVAIAVVAMAVACFFGAEWVERWMARKASGEAPASPPRVRNAAFAGMAAFGAFAIATLALPTTEAAAPSKAFGTLTPVALAERLVTDPAALHVVDLRTPAECAAKRVPGAACLPAQDPDGFLAGLPARTLVLYGAADLTTLPPGAVKFEGKVEVVSGGFPAFERDLLVVPQPPAEPTPDAIRSYRLRAALHGALTGSATVAAPVQAAPKAVQRASKKGGGC